MYNSPNAVLKGIRTEFAKRLSENANPVFTPMSFITNSSGDYEDYLFFDKIPYIKEWVDQIHGSPISDYKYTIRNKPYEFAVLVDRFTIDDSKKELGGAVEMQVKNAVDQWRDFPDKLIYDLMIANGTAFDGSAFFATSHNISGSCDNLKSGSGTTLAQITTDMDTARTAIYSYKDGNGIPFNRNPKLVAVIPPQLINKFLALKNSEFVNDGSNVMISNVYQGTFDILVNTWQATTDNDWYLVNANATVPAFIIQKREEPSWDIVDYKDKRDIKYLSTARINAGYGNFTAICKINNS